MLLQSGVLLAWLVRDVFRVQCLKTEDLHVNHVLVRLASILLSLLPFSKFLADFQELDLLPERIATTIPSVLGKIARLLHVRVAELASARCNCVLHYFLSKY